MPAPSSRSSSSTCPTTVTRALADPDNESPKPGDPIFSATAFKLVARPLDAFRAAEQAVRAAGYECVMLGDRVEGEAREVAADHARRALALQQQGRRAVMLSGGELTVTIRGQGRGGPNQEYALALAIALQGAPGITALAGDTDGTDGGGGLGLRPGRRRGRPDHAGAGPQRSASIRPIFSPTTIPPGFSAAWETWSKPVRPGPT